MNNTNTAAAAASSSASSEARADANRRNAQASTGPRTEAGKARSSQNARRAGWFARDLRVAEGQEQLYLEFEQAWLDELNPQGILELESFHDFVRASWHKREIITAQNEAMTSGPAAFQNEAIARQLDRYHRYERDFEARAARHLRELRRLQKERLAAEQPAPQKRTQPSEQQPPPSADPAMPEELRLWLRVTEAETNHMNARWRAHRAGLVNLEDSYRPAPPLVNAL